MPEQQGRTGSAGRFGARYGRVARRRVAEIEGEARDEHACPECGKQRVSRQGTGVWECGYCGYRYAGGAYSPETPGGKTVRRSIRAALAEDSEDTPDVEVAEDSEPAEDTEAPETDAESIEDE